MCPNCGTQVRADADFCPNCGQALKDQRPAAPSPGGQVQPPAGSAPQFRFDINKLNTADRVIAVASLLVFISVFLPWFGAFGVTVSGMSWHGYLAISLIAAVALIGYLVLRAGLESLRLPIAHAP